MPSEINPFPHSSENPLISTGRAPEFKNDKKTNLNQKILSQELREIQSKLSIPDSLKLPSLNLLFNYIADANASHGEFLKIDNELLDHVYFVKREKYNDGIIFLINNKEQQSLKIDGIQAKMAPTVNKIFEHYPKLGKIIAIPLTVDSLTDVLKILSDKPKTKKEQDRKLETLQSKLQIGSSQILYPEYKKTI